jgi:hypothetical protein
MSTQKIEKILESFRRFLEEEPGNTFYEWRIEQFEKILKERAEEGTY